VLAIVGICCALAAQQSTPTQPAQAAAQTKTDYSQEPFVIERIALRARFEKDGTSTREQEMRVRVQSEAGVQQLGQLVFGYNAANEKMEFSYVRVRKSDGTEVAATAADIQDLTSPVAREAPVYTDLRQKHVTVPGLRPGEILEYKVITRVHTPLAPGHFWMQHNFVDTVIVLDEQVEINVPGNTVVKLKTHPGREPQTTEEDDPGTPGQSRKIYRWKSANLEREPEQQDEGTAQKKKKRPEGPSIELTTFQSWEELGRWYAGLARERETPSAEIRAKVTELIRERPGDVEKIEAIYNYVAQNFRYVSLSFGVGRYQPHAAAEVFANQYGDCKDKHTLLASMLQAAGLRAYPVLIHASRKVDPELPSPTQFDHVISAVPLGNDLLWMDTTSEIAPFRLLAASLRNKQALVVTPGAPARLVTTPADPPFPSVQNVEVEGEISELGKLSARVHYSLRGDAELVLRVAFRRTPKNQWKQLAQLVAYGDGLRGEVSEVNVSELTATDKPLEIEYRISQPNFLNWTSRSAPLHLPLPAVGLPRAEAEPEETEPIELGTPLDVTTKLRLSIPAKYAARAPVAVGVARDYAEYRSRYSIEGNTITAERTIRFRQRELPASRARDYQAFVRAVRADEEQAFALESTAAATATPKIPENVKADDLQEAAAAAMNNRDFATAAQLFERVVQLEPKHKTAWDGLGLAYLFQLKLEQAANAFRKQIELNPYDENAYTYLGTTLWRQEKYGEAEAAFRKQIEVNPLDQQAHAQLGALLRERRRYAEAVPELEKAISLAPQNPALHVNIGQAYLNLGQGEKALAAFDKAVELAPRPTIWNNVAYELSLHKAHLDRAEQYAESAVATTAAALRNISLGRLTENDLTNVSGIAAYWDTLGWIHFQRGNLDKAEKYVTASWLLDFHGEVGDHLAQIHEKRGKKQEAIRQYARAMAATRPVPETRARLAALAGEEDKVDSLLQKARAELAGLKTVQLGRLLKEKAEADFFVVFAPEGEGRAAVTEVRFIRGDEKLQQFAQALRSAKYNVVFPDQAQTRLVRRGTLTCAATGECSFVMMTPDSVTSVN
jgi:tetratricopeptide (TPR) repeat protein